MDYGDTLFEQETEQWLGRVESVKHPDVGLVGIAGLVLVLVGGDVVFAGKRHDGVCVDQSRRDHSGGDHRSSPRGLDPTHSTDLLDDAFAEEHRSIFYRRTGYEMESPGQYQDGIAAGGEGLGPVIGPGSLDRLARSDDGCGGGDQFAAGHLEATLLVEPLTGVGQVEDLPAFDPCLEHAGVDAEGGATEDHEVGVLAGVERADTVVESQRLCGMECHGLQSRGGVETATDGGGGCSQEEAAFGHRVVGVDMDLDAPAGQFCPALLDEIDDLGLSAGTVDDGHRDRHAGGGDLVDHLVGLGPVLDDQVEIEFAFQSQHREDVVGAVGVEVDGPSSGQYLGQWLERQITIRRHGLLVLLTFLFELLPLSPVIDCLDELGPLQCGHFHSGHRGLTL